MNEQELNRMVKGVDFSTLNTMTEAGRELSKWEKERLGMFTSSKLGDLMKKGRANTASLRAKLKKLTENSVEYNKLKAEIELKERLARFGETSMKYIYEKVAEKITGIPCGSVESRATDWGNEYEAEAIEVFSRKTGIDVVPMGTTFIKFNEMCGGSPDGFINEDGIVEVKCPYNSANHVQTLVDGYIKPEYVLQMQGNMLFSEREYCYFISYDPRMTEDLNLKIIRVEREEQVCSQILARISQAYERLSEILDRYNLSE